MKTLVLFGDSLLAQCSKDEVLFLEAQLNNEYDVYNCATGGWNTDDLVKKASFIGRLQPDVVLISVGTNDGSPWKQIPLERFKSNLKTIVDEFEGCRIIFFPPPPIAESRRPENKMILNDEMRQYNQAVTDLCKENGIESWDSWRDIMPLIGTDKDPHNKDGVHFSDDGYKFILERLAKVVSV